MGAFLHMTGRNEEELCWLNKKDSDIQELAESADCFVSHILFQIILHTLLHFVRFLTFSSVLF